MLPLTGNQK